MRLFLDAVIARKLTVPVPERVRSNELIAFRYAPDVETLHSGKSSGTDHTQTDTPDTPASRKGASL